MPERDTPWPVGTPCWVDITVSDLARSQQFYRTVLGWEYTASSPEFGGYSNATIGGRVVAGMSPPMPGQAADARWTVYIATDDVAATDARAVAAGATQVVEPMQIGDSGSMGVWVDPTGSVFGAWQSDQHHGFALTEVPGTVAWTDDMSPDHHRARQFYAEVFGWTYQDMEGADGQYAIFEVGGQMAGGVGSTAMDPDSPPGWGVAFLVADVDASVQVLTGAGGTAGTPADFQFGRIAPVTGPDGEVFALYARQ